ncbi:MAG: cyclic-di-AMP receptor [Anaerolineales bacterium]|nr:cyclic-di-AMP receptor [Anaerolineales bacterium]
MKMIIAIIRDEDNDQVTQALITSDYRVTRIASTGGFLRRGSTTLIIGVHEERLEGAIQVIKENTSPPEDANMNRATLFVLNVEQFTQI